MSNNEFGGLDEILSDKTEAARHLKAAAPDMYREIQSDINELKECMEELPIGCPSYEAINKKVEHKEKLLAKARGKL